MPTITLQAGETAADYANPHAVTPTDLRQRGFRFVARYINGTEHHWKVLTPAERDRIIAAGLGLVLVFERSADRWQGAEAAGAKDGRLAAADAERLGYPTSEIIIPAFDQDVTRSTLPRAVAYWHAFRDACGHPTGAYGDYDVIDAIGLQSACNWQANAGGWSWLRTRAGWLKRTHPMAHMLQKKQQGGIDPNVCLRPFDVWAGGEGALHPVAPPENAPPVAAPIVWDPAHGAFALWPLNPQKETIQLGSTGDAVRYLQGVVMLKAGGGLTVTGVFEAITERRVKDLQRFFKMPETGVVDGSTWPLVDLVSSNP